MNTQSDVGEAALADSEVGFGTLILDRHGRILSSGDAVAQMLGENPSTLNGRDVADIVSGLCLGGSSARYRSGYLDYLAASPTWRELDAGKGRGSEIWFRLSAIVAEGQRLFLLTMRRSSKDEPALPGAEAGP
jgi:hypothetical protein